MDIRSLHRALIATFHCDAPRAAVPLRSRCFIDERTHAWSRRAPQTLRCTALVAPRRTFHLRCALTLRAFVDDPRVGAADEGGLVWTRNVHPVALRRLSLERNADVFSQMTSRT
jgi:hypothetical protein